MRTAIKELHLNKGEKWRYHIGLTLGVTVVTLLALTKHDTAAIIASSLINILWIWE